jgi:hypothetical protein
MKLNEFIKEFLSINKKSIKEIHIKKIFSIIYYTMIKALFIYFLMIYLKNWKTIK